MTNPIYGGLYGTIMPKHEIPVWKRKEACVVSQQHSLKPFVSSRRTCLNAAKSEKARSYRRKKRLTPVALATGWKQTRRGALQSAPAEKVNTIQLQQVSPQKQGCVAKPLHSPPPPSLRFFLVLFFISTREVVANITRRCFTRCGK